MTIAATAGAWYFWPGWPIFGWDIGVIWHGASI
jgi:hypothetical protein